MFLIRMRVYTLTCPADSYSLCLCWAQPCKNGSTTPDVVWDADLSGSKEPCIRWVPDPSRDGQLLRGDDATLFPRGSLLRGGDVAR